MTEAPELRFRRAGWAIFLVAAALRLVHVIQIRRAPFFTLLMGDARSYDAWAQRIAGGDWLGRDVFYQAPLYPYVLALIYKILGRGLLIVRLVQALIGSASCVILAYAVRRMANASAGIAAGLLLAVWAPAIFLDSVLQKSVLDLFFVCIILLAIARAADDARTRSAWFVMGLALGALSLTRENALVFLVVLIGWAIAHRDRLRRSAALLAGTALVLLPVAARNAYVGGGFYLTTAQLGPNFYIGNNPHADGTYAPLRYGRGAPEFERQDATGIAERAVGRRLSPSEVSAYWTDRALTFVTSQPGAWTKLMGRKLLLLLNRTEAVDTESQESYAEWSVPLRFLGPITHFGLLVPLAVLGFAAGWPPRGARAVVAALIGAYAVSVLAFYVFARYRYPLVPMLIVFASAITTVRAAALVRSPAAEAKRTKRSAPNNAAVMTRWRIGAVTAAVVVSAVASNWPMLSHEWMRAVSESNIGVALQDERRYDEAIEHYRRAVELRPDYAPALNNLGTAYRAAGRLDDAVHTYRRALELQRDFPDAEYNLANALLERGDADEAIGRFETALRSTESADVHNNLGTALAAKGRTDDAFREFRRALALDPSSAAAHRNIGDLLAARGEDAAAIDHLKQAVALDPSNADASYDLGTVLLQSGDAAHAADAFRAAIARAPAWPEAHNNLGIALGAQGLLTDAAAEFREALRLRPGFADAEKNLAMALDARKRGPRP